METKVILFIALLGASGCSVAPDRTGVHDPYEMRNRAVHDFNKSVIGTLGGSDESAVADAGGPFLPPELAERVINVADHLALPGAVVNNALQGDLDGVSINTMRFILNTLVGVGGIFDPAGTIGLDEVETDFGQTLAVWGVPEGAFLELPLVGPSTERDLAGDVVDIFIDPLGAVLTNDQALAATAVTLAARVAKIDQAGDVIGDVLEESADSYAQARLIYLQNRRFELGLDDIESVDPYDELFGEP